MVNFVRIYRNNEFTLLPLEEYLIQYHSEKPEGWAEIINWINRLLNSKTELDRKILSEELQIESFNIFTIKEAYAKLKNEGISFDDDVLRFIAFLFGTTYFSKIGNPTFDQWLNSIDLNHPFKKRESIDYGYTIVDASKYKLGQNAIRKTLLSTLKWISSQSGS